MSREALMVASSWEIPLVSRDTGEETDPNHSAPKPTSSELTHYDTVSAVIVETIQLQPHERTIHVNRVIDQHKPQTLDLWTVFAGHGKWID